MDPRARDRAREVLEAARAFSVSLHRAESDREIALEDLERAADGWAVQAETLQRFEGDQGSAAFPASTEERLAAVALDLDVAQVLVAAGIQADEVETDADPQQVLLSSVASLEEGIAALESPAPATAGFAAVSDTALSADDLPARFTKSSHATIDEVVDGTLNVLRDAGERLRELAPDVAPKVLAGLRSILDAAPQVGRFVRLGLQALKRALLALVELMPEGLEEKVRSWAQRWWEEHRDGVQRAAVEAMLEANKAKSVLQQLDIAAVKAEVLEMANARLHELGDRFTRLTNTFARVLSALAAAVAIATVVAAFVAAISAWVPLAAAAGYLLVAGSIILFARDYLDTGASVARVAGVQEIVRAALPHDERLR